jgi:HD-like signal output (HDOD) protein
MKSRILFVDDEKNVIQGLKRMLHSMRHEWDMGFAMSGQDALDILDRDRYDVLVTDMRMPGMSGAQLLNEVMHRYPHMVRIVLSGNADQEMILKSVRSAHQYLSKPCSPEILKSTVARAHALRGVLADDSLKGLVSGIETLPSLPSLYVEIMEALQSPSSSLKEVGEIISKDLGMTAKILQMVNSAFFGLSRQVSDPSQAVNLLGIETIKALVLSIQIFSLFDQESCPSFSLDRLWNHSMLTGSFAKLIAREEGQNASIVWDSYTAGMLHDLGKLLLSTNSSQQYQSALSVAENENRSIWEVEQEMFGISHAELGAYLTGLWGLRDSVVEAIAYHNRPERCVAREFAPLTAVHVADALAHEGRGNQPGETASCVNSNYLAQVGVTERLPVWRERRTEFISRGKDD